MKRSECSQFFGGEEIERELKEDQNLNANNLLKTVQSNRRIPIKFLYEEPPKESNTVSGKQFPPQAQRR